MVQLDQTNGKSFPNENGHISKGQSDFKQKGTQVNNRLALLRFSFQCNAFSRGMIRFVFENIFCFVEILQQPTFLYFGEAE